jgi:isopentenyldiphosphate isomerase
MSFGVEWGQKEGRGNFLISLHSNFPESAIMKNDNNTEIFPIVDEDGNTIGEAPRSVCHDGRSRLLHPVVHLHLFNSKGELFLQKRVMTKDIQPGKWDTSVGGHVGVGESVEEALARESLEELGLKNFSAKFLKKYIWESPVERELVNSFYTISDEIPVTDPGEIEEGKFWTMKEIMENLDKNIFTPNFENEFRMLNITFTDTINALK